MFPKYRDLISKLKHSDLHFTHIFERHNYLDQRIKNIESQIEYRAPEQMEMLKKEKLHLKDEIYKVLVEASKAG